MVFLFFLLIGDTLRTEPRRGVLGEIERRIHRYIATKAVLSAATGACVWLVLAALEHRSGNDVWVVCFFAQLHSEYRLSCRNALAPAGCLGQPGKYGDDDDLGHRLACRHPIRHR